MNTLRRRVRHVRRDDGMTTAEYAVGTVAACGFAGVLIELLGSDWIQELLKSVIGNAFSSIL